MFHFRFSGDECIDFTMIHYFVIALEKWSKNSLVFNFKDGK